MSRRLLVLTVGCAFLPASVSAQVPNAVDTPLLSHKRRGRMGLNRACRMIGFQHKANDGKEIQTHGAQWYRTRSVPQAGVET